LAVALRGGLDAVTVEAVASEAGISKAAFYRYFENLPEVMVALTGPLSTGMSAVAGRSRLAFEAANSADMLLMAYGLMAADLAQTLTPEAELLRLYLQERHGPNTPMRAPILELADQVRAMTLDLTQVVEREGFIKDHPEVATIIVLGAVHELISDFSHGRLASSPAELAPLMLDRILNGVRK